jgi:hypothetical protein
MARAFWYAEGVIFCYPFVNFYERQKPIFTATAYFNSCHVTTNASVLSGIMGKKILAIRWNE